MIDMKKLFKPYATEIHTLEETLAWIHSEGTKLHIKPEVIEVAIRETFLEMATGKVFSTEGIVNEDGSRDFPDLAHADMNRYLKDKMIELNKIVMNKYSAVFQRSINDSIKQYNIQKRTRLTNWNKSPIVRLFKRGS